MKNEFHDFKILIIGNDRGYRKYIHELINQLKLADTIEVIEGKSKLAEIWDCADIGVFAFPPRRFFNSILEGMISGTPMIVTNVGGNPRGDKAQERRPNSKFEIPKRTLHSPVLANS